MSHGDYLDEASPDMKIGAILDVEGGKYMLQGGGRIAVCSKSITYLLGGEAGLLADLVLNIDRPSRCFGSWGLYLIFTGPEMILTCVKRNKTFSSMTYTGITAGVSPDSQTTIDEVVNDVHYRWTDHFESHTGPLGPER
jgi:hypothetical protein